MERTMTQKNFVELRNVTKRFGSNTVIDNINLTIPQGQMVTLLGPSGCGKTTILRLVAGLEKPSEGQIFIDGEDVTHRSIQQRDICMVFQSYALFPHMSLGENVGYGLKMLACRARGESAGERGAGDGGSGRIRRPLCRSDLRRSAAARGAGPRADPQAESAAV
jgi:ABC-type Fe3+/spermidine/putrescine transport system ATPase subunit